MEICRVNAREAEVEVMEAVAELVMVLAEEAEDGWRGVRLEQSHSQRFGGMKQREAGQEKQGRAAHEERADASAAVVLGLDFY